MQSQLYLADPVLLTADTPLRPICQSVALRVRKRRRPPVDSIASIESLTRLFKNGPNRRDGFRFPMGFMNVHTSAIPQTTIALIIRLFLSAIAHRRP